MSEVDNDNVKKDSSESSNNQQPEQQQGDENTAAAAAAAAATTTKTSSTTSTSTTTTSSTPLSVSSVSKAESYLASGKVIVMFQATGNAPQLKQKKFKLSVTANFQNIIDFLRKQIRYKPEDSLFLYLNSTFQPAPDERIRDLFKCFHNNGKLVIQYCTTAAWG